MMGFLDFPASLFSWADENVAGVLPAVARVALWGAIAAAVSMALYWLVSPQQRIASIVAEERHLKSRLWDEDTEMSDGLTSAWALLRLALVRIGLVLVPVLIAALPVINLMTWMQTRYGYDLPPLGQAAAVRVEPAVAQGRWIAGFDEPPRVEVVDPHGGALHSLLISAAVPVVTKRVWWNALIGNPLGYLPDDSPVDRIEIDLQAKRYLSIGPDWIGAWETPFFAALLAASVLFKIAFRIR